MYKNRFCIILMVFVLILASCSHNQKTNVENISERIADVPPKTETTYVANKNTKKFHRPNCEAVGMMNDENKIYLADDFQTTVNKGYTPCAKCNPK